MKRLLVLAFENLEDLPKNWKEFSEIDAYGQSKTSSKDLPVRINLSSQFFEIGNFKKPKENYDFCFIRHPDPWGEPRNWMQAIAALGECLNGKLICEFWFPSEIKTFDLLLKSILGESIVKFVNSRKIENIGKWNNFEATWEINCTKNKKDMLEFYKKEKWRILQEYYQKASKFFNKNHISKS